MEFSIKNDNPEKLHSDCVIIGVYESQKLTNAAQSLDKASDGYLTSILKRGDLEGKADTTLLLHSVPGVASHRVLLVGLGKESEFSEKQFSKAVRSSVKALSNSGATKAVSFLAELPVKQLSVRRRVALIAETVLDATYRFDAIKKKKDCLLYTSRCV